MSEPVSILVLGPSGAGKSSFIRSALKQLGSGAVALAPGLDEMNSYIEMKENPAYSFAGFDDTLFMPSLGDKVVNGMNDLLRWQKKIYSEVMADIGNNLAPRYAAFAMDTVSAMGTLAYNATLVKSGRDTPPPALSPDGAYFYTLLKQYQEQMFHIPRALKGYGVNFIAVSHVNERDTTETSNANTEMKTKSIVAAVPGGFRDVLPSYFDLVFHAGVTKLPPKVADQAPTDLHYLRWKPNAKRPTKSRVGTLSESEIIPNDFNEVMKRVEGAIDARARA